MSVPTPSRTGEAPKRRRDAQRQEVDQARLKALKADEWLKAKADDSRRMKQKAAAAEKAANDRRQMDTAAAALQNQLMQPGGLAEHAHSIHAPPEGPTPASAAGPAPRSRSRSRGP